MGREIPATLSEGMSKHLLVAKPFEQVFVFRSVLSYDSLAIFEQVASSLQCVQEAASVLLPALLQ